MAQAMGCSTSSVTRSSLGLCATGLSFRSMSTLAPREILLRVPGLGARVVRRILTARRHVTLRINELARLVRSLDAVRPFVVTPDWRPIGLIDRTSLVGKLAGRGSRQLDLFA
jgi:predicted DNA-binding helix-hairpin-helix protein